MKTRERLDRILTGCRDQIQDEVSALLGKKFQLSKPQCSLVGKEDYFSRPAGKTVLAHLQLEGDLDGRGGLLLPLKGAIRIGGTLIMLPESELESAVSEEDYSEELEDSYGEIANIIAGSLTATFEEQYPKSFRFVRTEQEVILPVKVDPASDEPLADIPYYLASFDATLEEDEVGTLDLLLPAAPFGLAEEAAAAGDQPSPDGETGESTAPAASEPEQVGVLENEAADPAPAAAEPLASAAASEEVGSVPSSVPPKKDVQKQKKLVDRILGACHDRLGIEVGGLIGAEVKVSPEQNRIIGKEDFLDQAGGKQVMARMEIRGDGKGEAYLFTPIKDAIFLGGSLIMLPDSELEEAVRNEEFGEDAEDAFGEIANIIAGAFTTVFEEQYRKNLGFVKTGLETVVPVKIDPDSDEVLPDQLYYLSTASLQFNDRPLGRLQVLFPASVLDLEDLAAPEETVPGEARQEGTATGGAPSGHGEGGKARIGTPQGTGSASGATGVLAADTETVADILIITDTDAEAGSMVAILKELGYMPKVLHFKDPLHNDLNSAIRLIFLVMSEVNEQGFGVAIKISATGVAVPLVAAGPAWTRSLVLKAVRYGADDILITPASKEDIQEKLQANLARKAA